MDKLVAVGGPRWLRLGSVSFKFKYLSWIQNKSRVFGLTTWPDKDCPAADLFSLPEREVDEVGDPGVGLEPAGGGELGAAVRENCLVRRNRAALPLLTSEHMLSFQRPLPTALSTSHLKKFFAGDR